MGERFPALSSCKLICIFSSGCPPPCHPPSPSSLDPRKKISTERLMLHEQQVREFSWCWVNWRRVQTPSSSSPSIPPPSTPPNPPRRKLISERILSITHSENAGDVPGSFPGRRVTAVALGKGHRIVVAWVSTQWACAGPVSHLPNWESTVTG